MEEINTLCAVKSPYKGDGVYNARIVLSVVHGTYSKRLQFERAYVSEIKVGDPNFGKRLLSLFAEAIWYINDTDPKEIVLHINEYF